MCSVTKMPMNLCDGGPKIYIHTELQTLKKRHFQILNNILPRNLRKKCKNIKILWVNEIIIARAKKKRCCFVLYLIYLYMNENVEISNIYYRIERNS